jgi:hypothetical protein
MYISCIQLTSYSADLHIYPDWDDIQKDGIIFRVLGRGPSKVNIFPLDHNRWSENQIEDNPDLSYTVNETTPEDGVQWQA